MNLDEFLNSIGLNDHDKKVVNNFVDGIINIDDIDEKMDYVDQSTFYFDLGDDSRMDDIIDFVKESFV